MEQYRYMVNRQRKWMFYLLALFVLGWGFLPYREIFSGLILGTSISFFNLWLLQVKVDRVGQAAEQYQSQEKKKKQTLGSVSRLAMAALAVLIALRYPQYFHLPFVVVGLMTSYIVMIIDFALHQKEKTTGKRGEKDGS